VTTTLGLDLCFAKARFINIYLTIFRIFLRINHGMRHLRLYKTLLDGFVWTCSMPLAYAIKLETDAVEHLPDIFVLTTLTVPIKLLLVVINRHNTSSWRYAGVNEYFDIAKSITFFSLIMLLSKFFLNDLLLIPWSIIILEFVLSAVLLSSIRTASKMWPRDKREESGQKNPMKSRKRIIIAGAGEAGVAVARELRKNPFSGYEVVGFLDDDATKQKQTISGLHVLGGMSDMSKILEKIPLDEVIIAMPSAPGNVIRVIVEQARSNGLSYKIIPSLAELIHRQAPINQLRHVELEDLLGRAAVKLDDDTIRDAIFGHVVMVTGAGGSIGSEIVRQLCLYKPKLLLLLGRGENSLHQLRLELDRHFPEQSYNLIIGDVRDMASLEHMFVEFKPEVIYHTAAHKHVRLMEENPEQAIFNNVMGTQNLSDLCLKYSVRGFVNISTDKAINPSSIMGASKRITELITQQAASIAAGHQAFISVRFGNVLGSRGSVVQVFNDQIKHGGPVTVTHPDMVRYFMTVEEAAQLVLQASAMHINGCIFMLKMGDPVRIVDMARDLIRLSGFEPDKDIHIVYTGLTNGEKLFEDLLYDDEHHQETSHEKVMISRSNGIPEDLDSKLNDLIQAAHSNNIVSIKQAIQTIIPTFQFEE